jgi:hypothetical protein
MAKKSLRRSVQKKPPVGADMLTCTVITLTLREVQSRLTRLQNRYDLMNEEFLLQRASDESSVSEDDAMKWQAYLEMQAELLRQNDEIHERYLSDLDHTQASPSQATSAVELAVAA